ncbi:MAG: hypothetical protein ACYCPO_16985 [Acidobacteriaceae bacterium]
MRAEPDADIKRAVEVEMDRRAKLVHGLALQADEERDGVALLFNSDALRHDPGEAASEAKLHIRHGGASGRTLRQVDHASPMLPGHGFLGVVLEVLANDQHSFAVAEALRVRERNVGGE